MKFKLSILFLITILFISCGKDSEDDKEIILSLPIVQIDTISNITIQSAHIISNATDDGKSNISSRGICWSKDTHPSIDHFIGITDNNNGLGIYISEILDLEESTRYYVCSYAINEKGIGYSEIKSFTTKSLLLAQVNTNEAQEITASSAKVKGDITDSGNSIILARGFCWNKTGNPNLQNNIGYTEEGMTSGEFQTEISNLEDGSTYYACAYALNEKGHSYGNIVQFKTLTLALSSISTKEPENITKTSTVSGGTITNSGNSEILSKGVCWGLNENPSLENNVDYSISTTDEDSFLIDIINLDSTTHYYLRAYATNALGTSYGEQYHFKTLGLALPTVSTKSIINITDSSAICGGNIFENGGAEILAKGVCWSIQEEPSLNNNIGFTNEGTGIDSFNSTIHNLNSSTTYYIRAYATNSSGTSYGESLQFTTATSNIVYSIFEEFNDVNDYEDIALEGWTNIIVTGQRKWTGKTFNNEKYAQSTGYNSGVDEMETWLITPIIDNISTKTLKIKTSQSYWAHTITAPFTVMISEDFNGSNFEEATWYTLNIQIASNNNPDHEWIDSGEFNLSGYSGNAAIAFIYKGSDMESTSYRLDDVIVQEQ